MQPFSRVPVGIAAAVLGMSAMAASAQVMDAGEVSKVRLIAEGPEASPGQTVLLGLHFDLADHWHIYWDGRNDTGFPPAVEWDLPEGVRVGPMLWPTPSRYVSPGNILDHVYEGRPTILVPLTIGPDVAVGTKLTISGQVEWLVCHEVCLPGFGSVSVDLEVVPASNGPLAPLPPGPIAEAVRRLPVPVMLDSPNKAFSLAWAEDVVRVSVPGVAGASFFPAMESTSLANPIGDAHAQAGALHLRLVPPERDLGTGAERRLVGVVVGERADGGAVSYRVDFGPDGYRAPRNASAMLAAMGRLADPPAWWPVLGAR